MPAIVGFGKAAELAQEEMPDDAKRTLSLRTILVDGITSGLDEVTVNGHPVERLPHNANVVFHHVKADRLLVDMNDIAASTTSACSSTSPEPSHVLTAIGLNRDDIFSSVRFGLGRFTTEEEIRYTIQRVVECVKMARGQRVQPTLAHS